MIILKSLLLIILVISSISLIGFILLQRSKSEGLGLAFGASTVNRSSGRGQGMCFPGNRCFGGGLYGLCAALGILYAKQDKPDEYFGFGRDSNLTAGGQCGFA